MRRVFVRSVVFASAVTLVLAWPAQAQAQPSPERQAASIFSLAALQRQLNATLPPAAVGPDALKVKLGSPIRLKWDTKKAVFGGLAGFATGLLVAAADCSAGYKSSCSTKTRLLEGGALAGLSAVANGVRGSQPGVYPGWLDGLRPPG